MGILGNNVGVPALMVMQYVFIKETIVYFVEGKTQNTDNDSPVWVPDSEATLCMHCKKSQFTLINRRVSKQTGVLSNSYFDIEWGLRKIHGDFEAFQIFGLKYIMKWWLRCIQIHLDTFMVLKISII